MELFTLFAQYTEDFTLVWIMFMKICGTFIYNTADSGTFNGLEHYIKWHFQYLCWQYLLNFCI